MTPTWITIVLLAIFPLGIALLFLSGVSHSLRLAVWFASGYLMSQWMHVMIFVFVDRMEDVSNITKLNVLYFYHVKWNYILAGAILISALLAWTVYALCRTPDRFSFAFLVIAVAIALGLSQLTGSSIPKFLGEVSLSTFFLLGIFADRFFLTYPAGSSPPHHQIQSDALTTLGLLVALVSIWSPFVLGFAEFLFKRYFAQASPMLQFQLTRYAAYVAWNLIGVAFIGWRAVLLLIQARRGVLS